MFIMRLTMRKGAFTVRVQTKLTCIKESLTACLMGIKTQIFVVVVKEQEVLVSKSSCYPVRMFFCLSAKCARCAPYIISPLSFVASGHFFYNSNAVLDSDKKDMFKRRPTSVQQAAFAHCHTNILSPS